MSSPSSKPNTTRDAVNHLMGRELSAATIMFHAAIAERLGLSTTDHKALDLIHRHAPLHAGQLAKHTGLTTAAITGVVDRLEKAGYVKREADPNDRRRVVINPVPDRAEEIQHLFAPLSEAITALSSTYSDAELEIIYDFVTKAVEILHQQTRRLRDQGGP